MSDDRVTVPDELAGEDDPARTLRPLRLAEFVGQSHVREQLAVFLGAAAARGEPLDHVLLLGLPGLGKTTLANIIPPRRASSDDRLGTGDRPQGRPRGDPDEPRRGDLLFVDEIHRLGRIVEELLYSAMEDSRHRHPRRPGPGRPRVRRRSSRSRSSGRRRAGACCPSPCAIASV